MINNISVWWHVVGAAIIIAILIFLPEKHMSIYDVFTMRVNNSGGLAGGETSGWGFWFYVLPLGFLLTQYTITGFDASAHLSEETHDAADGAAKGIWRSIFYSAIGGWVLLLAFLFAVQDPEAVTAGGGGVAVIFNQALSSELGLHGAAHRQHRPVLLHHRLHDLDQPDAVRVQPRRRRAGLASTGRS